MGHETIGRSRDLKPLPARRPVRSEHGTPPRGEFQRTTYWCPTLSGWKALAALTDGQDAIATAGARMYPILPCADIDEAIAFYEALGFERRYRQVRPNPSAVVTYGELGVHLAGIDGFDPEQSYASVIIVVPDPDALYRAFADGLRAAYGRVPVAGIPRVVRPRKRWGTVYGFSLVDVGGNWLRISRLGDSEDPDAESEAGLARGIDVAARLADSHGDDAGGLATLERMLAKHTDAPAIERARALAYRADLAVRLDRRSLARASLDEIATLPLSDEERAGLAADIEHVEALLR